MVTETLAPTNFEQGFNKHIDTGLKRDVLDFWRKYPYAKFTCGIIARAVDTRRRVDVEEVLESLVQAELVDKQVRQGMPYYSLTAEPTRRQCVLSMPANMFKVCGRAHRWS